MQKYSIKEGVLYCNGELANIEFGDYDLINFIKQENERLESLQSDEGFEIPISIETLYKAEGNFKCICGQTIWIESEADDEDDAINDLVGTRTCRKCEQKFDIKKGDDNEIVAVIKQTAPTN